MKAIQMTPRCDHVRLIAGTFAFDIYSPLRTAWVRPAHQAVLLDIYLSVCTRPNPLIQNVSNNLLYPDGARNRRLVF